MNARLTGDSSDRSFGGSDARPLDSVEGRQRLQRFHQCGQDTASSTATRTSADCTVVSQRLQQPVDATLLPTFVRKFIDERCILSVHKTFT